MLHTVIDIRICWMRHINTERGIWNRSQHIWIINIPLVIHWMNTMNLYVWSIKVFYFIYEREAVRQRMGRGLVILLLLLKKTLFWHTVSFDIWYWDYHMNYITYTGLFNRHMNGKKAIIKIKNLFKIYNHKSTFVVMPIVNIFDIYFGIVL